jgi:RNA polymerase sigma-70 factor (ECF subfamily)
LADLYRVMGERGVGGTREERFTELFAGCYGHVLAFARRRVDADSAQDVVAETFFTAWRHLDQLPAEALPWLYRIAGHAVANHRRSLARRGRLDDRARLVTAPDATPDHAEPVAEELELAVAFRALSERDREVLRLATWEGLSSAAAATVMGCSPAAFKVRLHRARRRLSRMLETANERTDPYPVRATVDMEETSG